MATYPSFSQLYDSSVLEDDGLELSRSVSGKPRIRRYYTSTRRTFTVHHDLSSADKSTLLSFYTTNKLLTLDFVWASDGLTYACRFIGHITVRPIEGNRYSVVSKLVEV